MVVVKRTHDFTISLLFSNIRQHQLRTTKNDTPVNPEPSLVVSYYL